MTLLINAFNKNFSFLLISNKHLNGIAIKDYNKFVEINFRDHFPNGHIFRGKNRLVRRVEPVHINRLRKDFDVEEQNMLYLRHPYLTEAESCGHTKALGRREERTEKILNLSRRRFKEDITIYERLQHLHITEKWE